MATQTPEGGGSGAAGALPSTDPAGLAERTLAPAQRIHIDPENLKNGLGQLVLTLIKLLHSLLEKQAIRRMESGTLNDEQIERLGVTLMRQAEEIERLRELFGLTDTDLNLDLGPLGKLL